jgi:hypothetical protein
LQKSWGTAYTILWKRGVLKPRTFSQSAVANKQTTTAMRCHARALFFDVAGAAVIVAAA